MRRKSVRLGIRAALAAAISAAAAPAVALEEIEVCARIVAAETTVRLVALAETGERMNRMTKSTTYAPDSTYIIVLWENGAESAIELTGPAPTPEGTPGTDLQGNVWVISSDLAGCE